MKAKLSARNVFVEVVLICADLSCVGAAAASQKTSDSVDVKSTTVRYDDLDVTRPADARKLYSRIRFAARAVCDGQDIRNLADLTRSQACVEHAMDEAVAQVNSPELSSIHYNSEQLARR